MSDARLRSEWARTSTVLCMMANINRDEKKRRRPYSPSDFMPFKDRRLKDVQPTRISMKELCAMFSGARLQ